MKYKRILLKISGEVLAGEKGFGLNDNMIMEVCRSIKQCRDLGVEVGVVVGGGNFWRGRSSGDMSRVKADHIGMLATVMNAIALSDGLERLGVPAVVQTAAEMKTFAETYYYNRALKTLENGKVLIFGCGTGNPFCSTDNKYDDAVKYDKITPQEVLEKNINVMDSTAFALCKDNHMPILVFNLEKENSIIDAINDKPIGTLVADE